MIAPADIARFSAGKGDRGDAGWRPRARPTAERPASVRSRFWGGYSAPSVAAIAVVTLVAWILRRPIHRYYLDHPALLAAALATMPVLMLALAGSLWFEYGILKRAWLQRTRERTGLEALSPKPWWRRWIDRLPDPLEWISQPLLRTRLGKRLALDWVQSGFGDKPSRYFLLLAGTGMAGWLLGQRIGGALLSLALAFALPILPQRFVAGRAEAERRRFGEQLPMAMDAIAAGLAAGLSLPQAVDFAVRELPAPIAGALAKLSRRLALGFPVEAGLEVLLEDHPSETLALVVEGITLQRQFGGDLVRMLEETSELLRERVEIDREVRAITTQGKLSGMVVAALVPVSAGILLLTNPRYIDVLFETLIGQVLLVFAIVLQLAGWAVISRMVRIQY